MKKILYSLFFSCVFMPHALFAANKHASGGAAIASFDTLKSRLSQLDKAHQELLFNGFRKKTIDFLKEIGPKLRLEHVNQRDLNDIQDNLLEVKVWKDLGYSFIASEKIETVLKNLVDHIIRNKKILWDDASDDKKEESGNGQINDPISVKEEKEYKKIKAEYDKSHEDIKNSILKFNQSNINILLSNFCFLLNNASEAIKKHFVNDMVMQAHKLFPLKDLHTVDSYKICNNYTICNDNIVDAAVYKMELTALLRIGIYSIESSKINQDIEQYFRNMVAQNIFPVTKNTFKKNKILLKESMEKYDNLHEVIKNAFLSCGMASILRPLLFLDTSPKWVLEAILDHILMKADKIFPLKDLDGIPYSVNRYGLPMASIANFVDEKTYKFELGIMEDLGISSPKSKKMLALLQKYEENVHQRYGMKLVKNPHHKSERRAHRKDHPGSIQTHYSFDSSDMESSNSDDALFEKDLDLSEQEIRHLSGIALETRRAPSEERSLDAREIKKEEAETPGDEHARRNNFGVGAISSDDEGLGHKSQGYDTKK